MTEPTATFATEGHKPVLIEDWLPIRELGIESVRESAPIPGQFPKIKTLHVWWARAPLAASNGVALAALLPLWSPSLLDEVPGLAEALTRTRHSRPDLATGGRVPSDEQLYKAWVLWLCGVQGDAVVAAQRRLDGDSNSFTWKAAFKNRISVQNLEILHDLLRYRWGGELPRTLDPTAGGGSLPYSTLRYRLPTSANDLNPVAVGILEAGLAVSARNGVALASDLRTWGSVLVERCSKRLAPFFERDDDSERISAYLYANTVSCPRTGGPVPLAPNWWLDSSGDGVAAQPVPVHGENGEASHLRFDIVHGSFDDGFDPAEGSVARGEGISPWDGLVVDGDYIKQEAQEGRMWPTLYAVACRKPKSVGRGWNRYFRAPTQTDHDALMAASAELKDLMPRWEEADVLPTEGRYIGPADRSANYGILSARDMYTARQLLMHGTLVEEWRRLLPEVVEALGDDLGRDVMAVLAMMQGKCLTFNCRLTTWVPARTMLNNAFDRHDFAFKWTHGEFDGAFELLQWCVDQVVDAYSGIAELLEPVNDATGLLEEPEERSLSLVPRGLDLHSGSASQLDALESGSFEFVNIDPPYYDNVMYAELADFFYVWEKRTIGILHPNRYSEELTDKDNEAIANVERFSDSGRRRKELATFDYQQKMEAIFSECQRVLVDDGVMVVWFTHKRAEAWDTLATAMMESGFTIEASWPVSTQSITALNHAKKNSAKSTIMLVCRKRLSQNRDATFFEDIEIELRQAARSAVEKFEREVGVGGVDLQLATYGPTLSVISRKWPVLSSEPDESGRSRRLRPEEALDVARQEVARLRMQRLVGKDATFDSATDFWVMCWETFQAREFPYDEARKLALGVGHDVDEAIGAGLLKKKSGNVELISPSTRGRALRRLVDDSGRFEQLVDALHFMLVSYRDDKLAAARTWLSDSGYGSEQRFLDVVQAAVNAVPRVRTKKGLSVEEAVLLEDAVVALFGDEISLPVEAEEQIAAEQMTLDS